MQDKVDQLAGVFNSAFKFSSDFRQQLELSNTAAEGVVERLKEISAQKNLNFDSLFNATKSLSASGAGNLTDGSLEQTVTLAERFATVVKAARGDLNTQRVILSQIPNLLTGQVTGVNQILTMLGLTNDKWNAIVASSKVHHDLLQQLEPSFAPFVAQQDLAEGHQKELTAQLTQMFKEAEGHFARGLWEAWNDLLGRAVEYLKESRTAVDTVADALGAVVTDTAHLADGMLGVNKQASNLDKNFHPFLEGIVFASGQLQLLINDIKGLGNVLVDLPRLSPFAQGGPSTDELKDDVAQWKRSMDAIETQFKDRIAKIRGGNKDVDTPLPDVEGQKHPTTEKPPKKPKKTSGELKANAEAKYRAELEAVAEIRRAKEDAANYDFSMRRINEQQLHDQTTAALKQQQASVEAIGKKYEEIFRNIPGLDKTQRDTAVTNVQTGTAKAIAGLRSEQSKSDDRLGNSREQASLEELRQNIQETQKLTAIKIQDARNSGTSEAEVMRLEAQAKHEAFLLEQNDLQQQINAEAEGSNKRLQLQREYANNIKTDAAQQEADRKSVTARYYDDKLKDLEKSQKDEREAAKQQLDQSEKTEGPNASRKQREAVADLAAAYAVLLEQQHLALEALSREASAFTSNTQIIDRYKAAVSTSGKSVGESLTNAASDQRKATTGKSGDFENVLFGGNVTDFSQFGKTPDANGNLTGERDFGTSVGQLQHAFDTFSKATVQIVQSFEGPGQNKLAAAGGISTAVGGIGNAVSASKKLGGLLGGAVGQAAGVLGPLASIGGSIIGLFSDIFTAEAKRIAENIKLAFQATVTAYQNGAATLTTTLTQVEQQRTDAISQLSGKKGGQDQLNQILPQLNQEIAQLQNQQAQIQETFLNKLVSLRDGQGLSNDPLSQMLQTWQSINDQVQQYISAGGSAQNAQEALSLTLKQISTDAWTNLNNGEKDAITNALNLNQLLQQRITLENQYAQQVNSLLTSDSLQRRASQGVTAGLQITELSAQYQLQKDQLDAQISLGQQQVDLYNQIYSIKSSTVDLEAQQNAANIASLKQQIQLLKDYNAIYNNISQGADGQYGFNQTFQQSVGAVNINVLGGTALTQQQLTDAVTQALANSSAAGTGQTYQPFNTGG